MTGYSGERCVNIGDNLYGTVKKYLKKIDKVNNDNRATKRHQKKVEKRCYRKIEGKIDDMHWKAINYLTTNYRNIIVGDMSTHSIVNNKSNNQLYSMVKRVALLMKLYVFKQRLQFKCAEREIGYKEINEAYTSKTCTECSFLNTTLGSSKKFNCVLCGNIQDRDINASRNILIKGL